MGRLSSRPARRKWLFLGRALSVGTVLLLPRNDPGPVPLTEPLRSPFFSVRTVREIFERRPAHNETTEPTVSRVFWSQLPCSGGL
jgi:hypothetical protein